MSLDFRLVSEFVEIHRRPFELADPTLLDPTIANPLVIGEFLELDTAYKMGRGTANPSTIPSYCFFAERGRFETQAIQKGPMLYMGSYEADTKVMTATGLGVGDALEVADVSFGGQTRRGLVKATTGHVVGRVTRLPANNGGFLRYIRVEN